MELKQCCPPQNQCICCLKNRGEYGTFCMFTKQVQEKGGITFSSSKAWCFPAEEHAGAWEKYRITATVWTGFFSQQGHTIFSGKASPLSMPGHRWSFEGQGFLFLPCYPSHPGFHHSRGIQMDWEILSRPKVWQITKHFHKTKELCNCQFAPFLLPAGSLSSWLAQVTTETIEASKGWGEKSSILHLLLTWATLLPPEQWANEDIITIFF